MKSALQGREKKILIAAAVILALFILDRGLLREGEGRGPSLPRLVAREEAALARDLRLLARREDVMERHKRLVRAMEKPSAEDETTALLSDVETLARRHRVGLLDMKPSRARPGEASTLSVQAEGTWNALAAFFIAVEDSPAILTIEKGDLRLKGRDGGLLETRLVIRRRGEAPSVEGPTD